MPIKIVFIKIIIILTRFNSCGLYPDFVVLLLAKLSVLTNNCYLHSDSFFIPFTMEFMRKFKMHMIFRAYIIDYLVGWIYSDISDQLRFSCEDCWGSDDQCHHNKRRIDSVLAFKEAYERTIANLRDGFTTHFSLKERSDTSQKQRHNRGRNCVTIVSEKSSDHQK